MARSLRTWTSIQRVDAHLESPPKYDISQICTPPEVKVSCPRFGHGAHLRHLRDPIPSANLDVRQARKQFSRWWPVAVHVIWSMLIERNAVRVEMDVPDEHALDARV